MKESSANDSYSEEYITNHHDDYRDRTLSKQVPDLEYYQQPSTSNNRDK